MSDIKLLKLNNVNPYLLVTFETKTVKRCKENPDFAHYSHARRTLIIVIDDLLNLRNCLYILGHFVYITQCDIVIPM